MREAHDEDEINTNETQQIAHYHSVDHDDEWPDSFESPAKEQKVRGRREHDDDREDILDFVGAGYP